MQLGKEQLLKFYETMTTIRAFESKAVELFAAGEIPGFVHLSIGQEATAAGIFANLEAKDYAALNHRSHGHMIAKGADIKAMMAELYGKATGSCKGKGGSMHIADMSMGILGANGILGAGYTLATGAAFACKYRKTDAIAVCLFGDGQANRGPAHEAMNLASIWKLPVVFLCENNMFGISFHQKDHMNIQDISDRAVAYGFPGVTVDGNDVVAVYEATSEAVKRARRGDGPSLIEFKTWRHRGHFEGDPCVYRDQHEHEEWLKRDPITRLGNSLLELKYASKKDLDAYAAKADARIKEAVEFARVSPYPDPSEVLTDVFVD